MTKQEEKLIKGLIIGKKSETVRNPYSGESIELCPEAVAIYDLCRGAELLGDLDTLDLAKGIFVQKWPKEYMILLD